MPTIRARRALPPRSLVLPATAALLVALAGCSDTPAIPDADPTPSASPLFASEEEALEAATAVYEEYLTASNQVLQDAGENADRVSPYLAPEIFEQERASFQALAEEGVSFAGGTEAIGYKYQQSSPRSDGGTDVQLYVCVTNEGTVRLGDDGQPSAEQPPVFVGTFEVIVGFSPTENPVIDRKDFWSEGNQCTES